VLWHDGRKGHTTKTRSLVCPGSPPSKSKSARPRTVPACQPSSGPSQCGRPIIKTIENSNICPAENVCHPASRNAAAAGVSGNALIVRRYLLAFRGVYRLFLFEFLVADAQCRYCAWFCFTPLRSSISLDFFTRCCLPFRNFLGRDVCPSSCVLPHPQAERVSNPHAFTQALPTLPGSSAPDHARPTIPSFLPPHFFSVE